MNQDFDESAGNDGYTFEPAVPVTGAAVSGAAREAKAARTLRRRKGSLRRGFATVAVLTVSLIGMGGAYTLFATSSGASEGGASDTSAARGRQLFATSCITCHGANLQGVEDRGPSLVSVGAAAVYFQVSTGRMPATQQAGDIDRKTAKFNQADTLALANYVESMGGGPDLPDGWDAKNGLRVEASTPGNLGDGGELFRLNCASCHGSTFAGAPLSAGKDAPSLQNATDPQIYAAMLSGPENMPVFSDNEITPEQKKQIITYVQTIKASSDPGGHGIGRIGPVSEAIVIWVGGIGALMIAILWIGAKTQ